MSNKQMDCYYAGGGLIGEANRKAISETSPAVSPIPARLVSLREKAEASLHHWQRIREDSNCAAQRQNCYVTIAWLRGYLRALDDIKTP